MRCFISFEFGKEVFFLLDETQEFSDEFASGVAVLED